MPKFMDVPPVWTLICAVCTYLLARFAPLWQLDLIWLNWAGLIVIFLAIALLLWSASWFRRKKTPIQPRNKPTTLIVEGPYRLTRNPIYLAMVVFLLGLAVWFGALSGIIPMATLAVVLQRRFILPEEAGLRETFGAEAESYFANSRRWI